MFESSDDIDVDDEFLNSVFDNEEREISHRISAGIEDSQLCSRLEEHPAMRECVRNVTDKFCAIEPVNIRNSDGNQSPNPNVLNSSFHIDPTSFGNKENKRKQVSPPLPSNSKRERKFPGPAGLLPDRKSSRGIPLQLNYPEEEESPPISTHEDLCSQGRLSGSVLKEEPWQCFLADLGTNKEILEVVNVASVKRKAASRCFVGRKVPFLAAVLHHLDISSPDPCIILRDSTGEIHGTLHREVWEQFAGELVEGSVLVIRNVGLLSTGISSRRHYLNITANNLITIYSANPGKSQKRELHLLSSMDLNDTIEHWRSLVAPPRTSGSTVPLGSPTLFSSHSSSGSTSSPLQSPHISKARPHLVGPKSTENNYKQTNAFNGSNSRPTVSRSIQENGRNCRPQNYRQTGSHNVTGKNLFPLLTKPNNQVSNCSLNNSISSTSRTVNHANNNNSLSARNTVGSSLHSESMVTSNVIHMQTNQTTNSASKKFNFNPVIMGSKRFSNEVFPQSNSERQLSKEEETNKIEKKRNCESKSDLNNSKMVLLSQCSQLTVEEQSVVDSVFEGIDADSLFDDDF